MSRPIVPIAKSAHHKAQEQTELKLTTGVLDLGKILYSEGARVLNNKLVKLSVGLLMLGVIVSSIAASYFIGFNNGFDAGHINGYNRGKFDLSLSLMHSLGNFVDKSTYSDDYSHLLDINDITIYVYEKNGVKTIAFWKYIENDNNFTESQ